MSWAAVGVAGASVISGTSSYFGGKKAEKGQERAAQASAQAANRGIALLGEQFNPALQALEQGYQGGIEQIGQMGPAQQREAALSGALGPEAQQEAMNEFIESPGQQFLRSEQERALLRNSAAIGGLGGGNIRSALQEQAFGRAATNMQQRLSNISGVAGREQQTSSNLANLMVGQGSAVSGLRSNYGANMANIATGQGTQQAQFAQNIGNTQASGAMGIGSAINQGIGGLSQLYGAYTQRPLTQNPALRR